MPISLPTNGLKRRFGLEKASFPHFGQVQGALYTILDANITTIVAAAVLFYYGDFSIQGFALMLIVSIVLSMVTAVLGFRLLLGLLVASRAF